MKNFFAALLLTGAAAGVWLVVAKAATTVESRIVENSARFKSQLLAVKKFLKDNPNYNSSVIFLVDMKIPSGKNRFFVYDLKLDSTIDRGLVAHGSGSETGVYGKLKFSNVPNSLCTSLGKYSIGKSYSGQFGKAYKLYGLDPTNSNAYSRNIVLHKYDTMPYDEQPGPIRNSFGCPMVSVKFYDRLQKHIDNSAKPIILDIYY